jgi:hypothetical protein
MKPTSLIVALTLACAISSSALAGEKTKDAKQTKPSTSEQSKAKSEAPLKEDQVTLTGSYIKRDVRRNGVVTDGSSPLYVLDRKAIEMSGAANLSEVLIRRGVAR